MAKMRYVIESQDPERNLRRIKILKNILVLLAAILVLLALAAGL